MSLEELGCQGGGGLAGQCCRNNMVRPVMGECLEMETCVCKNLKLIGLFIKRFGTLWDRNGMCEVTFCHVFASSLDMCLRCLELPGSACK